MKKSKGFTLVELLAVIVILAILVLAATPAVTGIMQKSQKNTFKSEIISISNMMNTVYTEKSGKGVKTTFAKSTDVYNISTGGKSYKYICMELSQLVSEQYIKKDLKNYKGYIAMWVPDGAGDPIIKINVSNTSFYMQGTYDKLSASDYLPSQGAATDANYITFTCPTATPAVATSGVFNK